MNPNAYYNLGNLYSKIGNLEKAEHNFRMTIKLDEKDAKPYFTIGLIYYLKKDFNKSIEYYSYGLKLNHNYTIYIPKELLVSVQKYKAEN